LWRYCKAFGFNFEQSKEIVQSLKGQPGKRFFSSSHLLVVDRDVLIITLHQHYWDEIIIEKGQAESFLGPWHLKVENLTEVMHVSDELEAILNAEQLTFPIVWRKWRPGDYFHPLGMEHKKKLSDFFIDKILSVADKESATVLESDGRIVWVVWYRIDDRFKLTSESSSMVRFTLNRAVS